MADKTSIEWTDATWNPTTGCTKVSAGCKHCYAERDWARLSANPKTRYFGRTFTDVQEHADVLTLPLRWTKPRRIFVNSMSDLFHESVSDRFIADVFGIMAAAHWHTYQVLTKRPERALHLLGAGCMGGFENAVEECLALYSHNDLTWPLPNVWLGVSVEDQVTADGRIPLLLQTPAAVRWVSAEPLLGPVSIEYATEHSEIAGLIDWVVAGGESGPKARPMHPDWPRSLRDECEAFGAPFLFKQWGEWSPGACATKPPTRTEQTADWWDGKWHFSTITPRVSAETTGEEEPLLYRLGKKTAGRLLDGVLHDTYPEEK